MKRRLHWPRVIMAALFVSIILFGASYFIVKQSLAVVNNAISQDPIVNSEKKALSEFPGLELKIETEEGKNYTSSISSPITENDKINAQILSWIEKEKANFIKNIDQFEQTTEENRAHLNIQLKTEKAADQLYSLLFTSYSYTGGANGETTVFSKVIDLKNNKTVELKDIMTLTDETKKIIRSYIKDDLKSNKELSPQLDDDALEKALKNDKNLQWSINKTDLTVRFSEYEIAAGSAGVVTATIPLEKLQSLLKKETVKLLNVQVNKDSESEKTDKLVASKKDSKKPSGKDKSKTDSKKLKKKKNGKYVALTFDDGPSGKVTPRVLKTLKKYNAKATFFMLGSQVDYYPDIVKQIAKEGHELANHSRSHPDLTKLTTDKITKELINTSKKIEGLTGVYPKMIRPPYGAINDNVKKVAKNNGITLVLWSVDTLDWKNRNPQTINQIVAKNVKPGSVILMHDIHSTTADALPKMLEKLSKDGYEFVTISELLEIEGHDPKNVLFYGK